MHPSHTLNTKTQKSIHQDSQYLTFACLRIKRLSLSVNPVKQIFRTEWQCSILPPPTRRGKEATLWK